MTSLKTIGSLATVLAVAACASKETAQTAAPPPAPIVVAVNAADFAYTMPAQISAGFTTFKLKNAGPNLHHMVIARIDSGKTYADAEAALTKPHGPPPTWLVPVGGPNAPDPQSESNATIDMKPGEYVAFCMVDIPGGVPHVAKGMISHLTVAPATGPTAAAPTAHAKLSLSDYKFELSAPLTAGQHTIEVVVAPGQPHEVELIKLAPGKTLKDFMDAVGAEMSGKPVKGGFPANMIGGVAPFLAGSSQFFDVNLTPGNYVLMCFVPDAKDQKMHLEHGMIHEFTVQ